MEKFDDAHMQRVIGHGRVAVLGHNVIYADDARVGRSGFKADKCLRKHLFFGEAAKDLIEVADFDMAGRSFVLFATVFELSANRFGFVEARVDPPRRRAIREPTARRASGRDCRSNRFDSRRQRCD